MLISNLQFKNRNEKNTVSTVLEEKKIAIRVDPQVPSSELKVNKNTRSNEYENRANIRKIDVRKIEWFEFASNENGNAN